MIALFPQHAEINATRARLKLEYLHVDFGSQLFSRTLIANGFFFARSVTLTDDRAGVNYNFGWGGPVVARY